MSKLKQTSLDKRSQLNACSVHALLRSNRRGVPLFASVQISAFADSPSDLLLDLTVWCGRYGEGISAGR